MSTPATPGARTAGRHAACLEPVAVAGSVRSPGPAPVARLFLTCGEMAMKQRWYAVVALLLASAFGLSACNTVQGMGKDVERGGEKVQDAAERTKQKM